MSNVFSTTNSGHDASSKRSDCFCQLQLLHHSLMGSKFGINIIGKAHGQVAAFLMKSGRFPPSIQLGIEVPIIRQAKTSEGET